jgi:hypothetical protein
MFSAKRTVGYEVMIVLADVLMKGDNRSVQSGVIDRDIAALAISPRTEFELEPVEFDCPLVGMQQLEANIRTARL